MKRFFTLATLAAAVSAPASAAEFDFSYTRSGVTATGVFTTTDVADANGFLLITALSGTRNGAAMTLLALGTFPASGVNDNLFRETAPQLTISGFSFTTDQAYNVYSPGGSDYLKCISACMVFGVDAFLLTSFTATRRAAGAVPEPATWAMMIGGFGLFGGAMRHRAREDVAAA